jgi:hypothetical protein
MLAVLAASFAIAAVNDLSAAVPAPFAPASTSTSTESAP